MRSTNAVAVTPITVGSVLRGLMDLPWRATVFIMVLPNLPSL